MIFEISIIAFSCLKNKVLIINAINLCEYDIIFKQYFFLNFFFRTIGHVKISIFKTFQFFRYKNNRNYIF